MDVLFVLARPALLLGAETRDELASGIQFTCHFSLTLEQDVEFILLGLLGGVELLELIGDLLEGSERLLELSLGLFLSFLHLFGGLLLWLHHAEDVIIFVCS